MKLFLTLFEVMNRKLFFIQSPITSEENIDLNRNTFTNDFLLFMLLNVTIQCFIIRKLVLAFKNIYKFIILTLIEPYCEKKH